MGRKGKSAFKSSEIFLARKDGLAIFWFLFASLMLVCISCRHKGAELSKSENKNFRADCLHQAEGKLSDAIVYDIFSPPVVSRIYVYSNLAFYEAARFQDSKMPSIVSQLKGFGAFPKPVDRKRVDFTLAGLEAFYEVGRRLVFSSDSLDAFWEDQKQSFRLRGTDESTIKLSTAFGKEVAALIIKRAESDNYKETRGLPRYAVTNVESKWKPTAPDYMDAVEPWFGKIRPMLLESSNQFRPEGPNSFTLNKASRYYLELMEVYTTRLKLSPVQVEIANFWDCNPFTGHHKGHLMYATKKISPGGHWVGIAGLACRNAGKDVMHSAEVYTWLSITLFDSFISCWQEKYTENTVRPETVIHEHIDEAWNPLLQCPPFPDYPSGHGVISASSSVILSRFFGPRFAYVDSVEVHYGIRPRRYSSFSAAADEAARSRIYGGIHFRKACKDGLRQGLELGKFIASKAVFSIGNK